MKDVFDFDKNMTAKAERARDILWRCAKDGVFGIYGSDALHEKGYCRLTEAERDTLRPVNDGEAWFGEHSAGIQVRFESDSAQIFIRVKLRSPFDMTNMTQTGQCGADLYVFDEGRGEFVLHEVARYDFHADRYEVSLSHFGAAPRKMRRYLLYFPLYMAADEFDIGLDKDAAVKPFGFSRDTRIGVYGTSITHGCSASRPGMAYTNLLSRRTDEEVLNFGFSGVAFMEPEMGEILGKRRLDFLVVDAEANAGVDERMRRNAEPFLNAFLQCKPQTPVLLFSRVALALDLYDEARARLHRFYVGFLRELAQKFRRRGYRVFFADGTNIFKGNFTEYFTDGIHPTDRGMAELARAYERQIGRIRRELK